MAKIDEQVSYNWLFFLLAGLFAAVTAWAIYDETVTRREYKGFQEQFFRVEADLDKRTLDAEQKKLDSNKEYAAVVADLAQRQSALNGPQRDAYEKATHAVEEAHFAFFDMNQRYTFAKSEATEDYYYYTEAKHEWATDAKRRAQWTDVEQDPGVKAAAQKYLVAMAKQTERDKETSDLKAKEDVIKAQVAVYDGPIDADQKKIKALEKPRDDAARKYQQSADLMHGLFGPDTEIVQENLPNIDRVDRCESCHMGSNRGGFEAVEPFFFRSHPFRRTIFKYHPVEKFGCTSCHDGQGPATTQFYAHAPSAENGGKMVDFYKHFWEWPLLKGPEMEANCRTCHLSEISLKSTLQCDSDVECAAAATRAELVGDAQALMTKLGDPAKGVYSTEAIYRGLAGTDLLVGYQATPDTAIQTVDVKFPATATDQDLTAQQVADTINAQIGWNSDYLKTGHLHGKAIEVQALDAGSRVKLYSTDANNPERTGAERIGVLSGTAAPILGFAYARTTKRLVGGQSIDAFTDGDPAIASDTRYSCREPGTGLTPDDTAALAPLPSPPASASQAADQPAAPAAPKGPPPKFCSLPKNVYNVHGSGALVWSAPGVELGPHQERGRQAILETGCFGCHPVEGYENLPKNAPNLAYIKYKLNPANGYGWITAWIEDPKSFSSNTRMPRFFPELQHSADYQPVTTLPTINDPTDPKFDEAQRWDGPQRLAWYHQIRQEEVTAIVSFLVSDSSQNFKDVKGNTFTGQSKPFTVLHPPVAGDPANGQRLVSTLGCFGCHDIDIPGFPIKHRHQATHFDFGPNLSDEGVKTTQDWIYTWLKDPKGWDPDSRMPNLRLSDAEAADVSAFLMTMKKTPPDFALATNTGVNPNDPALVAKGAERVKYYGCYGCHNVTGYETTPGIGVDLSEFGAKSVEQLDFGDYVPDPTQQTWHRWVHEKLLHPRVYRYERVETRMPQFDFTQDEIADLTVVLRGMRGDEDHIRESLGHQLLGTEALRSEGEKTLSWNNCQGCHTFEGVPGDIRQKWNGDQDLATYAPPVLDGEGERIQQPWLFGFLEQSFRMRPLVEPRMPTFGFADQTATNLVAMFAAQANTSFPFEYYGNVTPPDAEESQIAQTIFVGAQCTSCHLTAPLQHPGDVGQPLLTDPGRQGPDLSMSKDRLRAEWVRAWVASPATLVPGVNMSGFWDNRCTSTGAAPTAWQTVLQKPAVAALPAAQRIQDDIAAQIDLVTRYLWFFPSTESASGAPQASATGANPAAGPPAAPAAAGRGGHVPRAPQAPTTH